MCTFAARCEPWLGIWTFLWWSFRDASFGSRNSALRRVFVFVWINNKQVLLTPFEHFVDLSVFRPPSSENHVFLYSRLPTWAPQFWSWSGAAVSLVFFLFSVRRVSVVTSWVFASDPLESRSAQTPSKDLRSVLHKVPRTSQPRRAGKRCCNLVEANAQKSSPQSGTVITPARKSDPSPAGQTLLRVNDRMGCQSVLVGTRCCAQSPQKESERYQPQMFRLHSGDYSFLFFSFLGFGAFQNRITFVNISN